MATITDKRSINATLSTTTVDRAQLLQAWDAVEVTNLDTTNAITLSMDGATNPTPGGEGFTVVPPGQTKILRAPCLTTTLPDGSTVVCHEIRVLGNGGSYVVEGLSSAAVR